MTAEPLPIEKARRLARRFIIDRTRGSCESADCDAYHCPRCGVHTFGHCVSCDMCDLHDEHGEEVSTPVADSDRERLFAWVHDYLRQFAPLGEWVECEQYEKSSWVADELRVSEADARDLCAAAGWPS